MDPNLLAPDTPLGFPAPYWFLVMFKVLGFTLHILPMHLWFAGMLVMLLLRRFPNPQAERLSDRVMNILPVAVGYGVNLGIVPLLFTQVAYYKVFYPAGILMAWPWFSVIGLLTLAYYGVYLYALGLRAGKLTRARVTCGWTAAGLFLIIGWLFTNNFSLMTNVGAWRGLWQSSSIGGAPLGTALNLGDPTLWPRWLMMFGLALTSTAAWVAFDSAVFAAKETGEYRRWAWGFAVRLYAVGFAWFAVAGSWYFFGALEPIVRTTALSTTRLPLTMLTAGGPGLVWTLVLLASRRASRPPGALGVPTPGRKMGIAILTAQLVVLGLNAISRQLVQNAELAPYMNPASEQVRLQLGPLLVFLLTFAAGLFAVIWILRQAIAAARQA